MAQYTPNFNLYEPDSSDDFADFRTEFNNNMDIIDQNLGGGGGSGGHTIYDKDGNALAQESGLQFTGNVNVSDDSGNGRTVVDILGGGGNVYGAFIDPSRVIYSAFTFDSSTHSWTATEDCILTDNMTPPDGSTAYFIRIDGKQVFAGYSTVEDPFIYVKKGQVVEYRAKSGSTMKAYGILQGTNGIFAPVIYSDNERVIGVWRDNKPLYQKTFLFHSTDSQGNYVFQDVSSLNIDSCVEIKGTCDRNVAGLGAIIYDMNSFESNQYQTYLGYSAFNGKIQYTIKLPVGETTTWQVITLRYTKTTDVAGSGNWNTDGVPTHHYSTSEQVVGTWTNGKPCYEITLEGSGSYASNIEHIISIPLNADNVRIMSGFVDIGTDWLPISLTLGLGTGTTNGIYCYPNKSNGLHLFSSAWTFTNYSIVIQYTKTTDT